MLGRQLFHQRHVERLDEAHVGHRRVELVTGRHARCHHGTEGQDGDALALALEFALADLDAAQFRHDGRPRAGAARIADGGRARIMVARCQHLAAFVFVGRGHDDHVRDAAQKRHVVVARVRGAVGAHQAGAVQRERHVQVLQGHVVDQLVVGALQKGRVNGHDGFQAFASQARAEGHGMLFGNTDVEIAGRELLFEFHHARAFAHGRRDAHQALVVRGHVAQPVAEHFRVRHLGRRRGRLDAFRRIELARAVVQDRLRLGQLVALALLGDHVQELRTLQLLDILQGRDQRIEVVAVDGADIVKTEFLEHGGGHDHALGVLFKALRQFQYGAGQDGLADIFRCRIELARHQPRQVAVQRAHGRRDRHVVVVQDHQQVDVFLHARIVHRLEGHAGRHRAVADHGDRVQRVALDLGGLRHAQRGGNRRRRVRRAKRVVFALVTLGEAGNAVLLAQGVHALAPARQDLVRIGLVAHVPHDAVVRRVEHVMQRDGQLDRAQVGRQVAARLGDGIEQEAAQFLRQRHQLRAGQLAHLRWFIDGF